MKIQKLVGLLIVIFIIFGAVSTVSYLFLVEQLDIVLNSQLGKKVIVGFQLFNDIHSILFVLGGATGYSFLKSSRNDWIKNIGNGAVYFGWLGTLIGLIAIAGNRFDVWGDMDKMGPALAVAMLTIFYGYLLKLITMAFEK